MIISRTPFRLSLFGGGTDYPAWYLRHGGAVLATTIDKYCWISCRYLPPFFEHRHRIAYSQIEMPNTVDEIRHPAVREVLKFLEINQGIAIQHDGDLPARSGMGSSSAFTVGLLNALHGLSGHMPTKHQLATEGIHIEQERLREAVGSQDQVLAAYGGLSHVVFHPNGEITVRPVTAPPRRIQELHAHLMLFYTGIRRTASKVAKTYIDDIDQHKWQLRVMERMVGEGLDILCGSGDLAALGELLHEAWQSKRSLSASVSNPTVDAFYERARDAGAIGAKITGAGGGGFLLVFAPPSRHEDVRAALYDLLHVPFKFESHGSQIVFFDSEQDYSAADVVRSQQKLRPFTELPSVPPAPNPTGS
jgi:D-glycero-alpha-D-manno-heptose-7-phosphate kinase